MEIHPGLLFSPDNIVMRAIPARWGKTREDVLKYPLTSEY